MAKKIAQNSFDDILHALLSFSGGASIKELNGALEVALPQYTLQRRLTQLVRENKIETSGKARALRYTLPSIAKTCLEENSNCEEIDKALIPLSDAAKSIRKKVRQATHARIPVGYNRDFLDKYRPNISRYLSEDLCRRLFDLGSANGNDLAGSYAREVFSRLLIDLSWNSSRLEGNTYSLLETERLLNLSEIAEGKDLKEAKMILNHKEAIEFLVDSAPDIGINRYTILNLHALLSNDLMGDLGACGRLRSIPVGIGRSVYHPLSIPQLITECFQQVLDTAKYIKDPFEQAFFLMVHLPYLQPFEDVNKRTSRLAANIPFIQHNLCPLSFVDVPQDTYIEGLLGVYELNSIELLRDVFVWAYERSCQRYSIKRRQLGEPDPFRLKYRNLISGLIRSIVHQTMNKPKAIQFIKNQAQELVPAEAQLRFIEAVEQDLMSIHEGNIARHRLNRCEFEAWQKIW